MGKIKRALKCCDLRDCIRYIRVGSTWLENNASPRRSRVRARKQRDAQCSAMLSLSLVATKKEGSGMSLHVQKGGHGPYSWPSMHRVEIAAGRVIYHGRLGRQARAATLCPRAQDAPTRRKTPQPESRCIQTPPQYRYHFIIPARADGGSLSEGERDRVNFGWVLLLRSFRLAQSLSVLLLSKLKKKTIFKYLKKKLFYL